MKNNARIKKTLKANNLYQEVIIISADSSCTFSAVVLLRIIRPPINRMVKATNAHEAITPAIGSGVPLFKKLTSADVKAPIPICILPNNADALPASLLKGASDNAEVLGNVNPWQLKKIKHKNIVLNNPKM